MNLTLNLNILFSSIHWFIDAVFRQSASYALQNCSMGTDQFCLKLPTEKIYSFFKTFNQSRIKAQSVKEILSFKTWELWDEETVGKSIAQQMVFRTFWFWTHNSRGNSIFSCCAVFIVIMKSKVGLWCMFKSLQFTIYRPFSGKEPPG